MSPSSFKPESSRYRTADWLLFGLAEVLGPLVVRLLGRLCRYKVEGQHYLETAEKTGSGAIIALWHGRMLLPVYHLRGRGICSLVSLHRDGEIIARVVRRLGYIARRGSPREGGREGFQAMVKDLRAGKTVAIFPDGPTGPRHSVRDGVIHLARITGAPIVPISFSAHPAWIARSWDRFTIPKPLSRGIILMHPPFYIERKPKSGRTLDDYRCMVRERLCAVEEDCDRRLQPASTESIR